MKYSVAHRKRSVFKLVLQRHVNSLQELPVYIVHNYYFLPQKILAYSVPKLIQASHSSLDEDEG